MKLTISLHGSALTVGPRLTPYHPFFAEGSWRFPIDFVPTVKALPCKDIVSFIVRGAPALLVEDVPCVALGHGLQAGAAGHPFFLRQSAPWRISVVSRAS